MKKEEISAIARSMDWEPIESKNPLMLSFINGSNRLNVYFTTLTVTVQGPTWGCRTFRNVTELEFEKILESHYEGE